MRAKPRLMNFVVSVTGKDLPPVQREAQHICCACSQRQVPAVAGCPSPRREGGGALRPTAGSEPVPRTRAGPFPPERRCGAWPAPRKGRNRGGPLCFLLQHAHLQLIFEADFGKLVLAAPAEQAIRVAVQGARGPVIAFLPFRGWGCSKQEGRSQRPQQFIRRAHCPAGNSGPSPGLGAGQTPVEGRRGHQRLIGASEIPLNRRETSSAFVFR